MRGLGQGWIDAVVGVCCSGEASCGLGGLNRKPQFFNYPCTRLSASVDSPFSFNVKFWYIFN